MTRRTLAEASEELDRMQPMLSDYHSQKLKAALSEAQAAAGQFVTEHVNEMERGALELRTAALQELTTVRDAMDDLAPQFAAGRVSAEDGALAIAELHQRQEAAEAQLARVAEVAASMGNIEDDPLAWYSDVQERLPSMRWECPW
jgi:hypothetical protein